MPRSAQDEHPAAGGWSPREVLAHLLHAETVTTGPRVKRGALSAAENDGQLPNPEPPQPPPGDVREMSNDWADARADNLGWLRQLSAEQRARMVRHPRFGE